MPRKAPSIVQEHRITLGDFERREFKESIDKLDALRQQQITQGYVKTAAYVGAAGVVSWLGYQTWIAVSDIFTGNDVGKNQTGGYLWDNLKYRAGLMSQDEFIESTQKRMSKEEEKGGGGFWKWIVGGSDEKFFFWDI